MAIELHAVLQETRMKERRTANAAFMPTVVGDIRALKEVRLKAIKPC